jgi:hypothetical protein
MRRVTISAFLALAATSVYAADDAKAEEPKVNFTVGSFSFTLSIPRSMAAAMEDCADKLFCVLAIKCQGAFLGAVH